MRITRSPSPTCSPVALRAPCAPTATVAAKGRVDAGSAGATGTRRRQRVGDAARPQRTAERPVGYTTALQARDAQPGPWAPAPISRRRPGADVGADSIAARLQVPSERPALAPLEVASRTDPTQATPSEATPPTAPPPSARLPGMQPAANNGLQAAPAAGWQPDRCRRPASEPPSGPCSGATSAATRSPTSPGPRRLPGSPDAARGRQLTRSPSSRPGRHTARWPFYGADAAAASRPRRELSRAEVAALREALAVLQAAPDPLRGPAPAAR